MKFSEKRLIKSKSRQFSYLPTPLPSSTLIKIIKNVTYKLVSFQIALGLG